MFANDNDLPMLDVGFHHPQRTVGYDLPDPTLIADQPVFILCSDFALTNSVTFCGVFTAARLLKELRKTTIHDEDNPNANEECYRVITRLRDGMTVRFPGNDRGDLYYFVTRVPPSALNGKLHIASVKDTQTLGGVEIFYAYTAEQLQNAIQEYCFADPDAVNRGVINDITIHRDDTDEPIPIKPSRA